MKIDIKNRYSDCIMYSAEAESLRIAVEQAVKSGANLTRANLDGANLDGANLDGASLDGASLYGASLYGASLYGASLYGANLTRANLYGANLDGANLDGANLDGANLDGASLYGANLTADLVYAHAPLRIQGSRHTVFHYAPGRLAIGCHKHTIELWARDFQKIGQKEGYSEAQIVEYGLYIALAKARDEAGTTWVKAPAKAEKGAEV